MKTELFDIPVCESPRMKWLKARNVTRHHWAGVSPGDEDEFGNEMFPWTAFIGDIEGLHTAVGGGNTEHEAIVDLAVKKGWKMWNEE